jgi:succinate dehydrogenase flavin-adding protein (antitoxin of CptAB toxin-antitoxin module)
MKNKQEQSQEDKEQLMRQLQYRLRRQGMLELDAWLAPLLLAINTGDADVLAATKEILMYEVPDLLALQAGSQDIPEALKPWLKP